MKTSACSVIIVLLLAMTSCAPRIPFTQGIRDKYKLSEAELKSIQFYTSDILILKRGEVSEREKDTKEGTLTIKGGNKVEEVVIKAGTPCVIEQVFDGNRVSISFEDGKNKFLVFGSLQNKNGYYILQSLTDHAKPTVNYGEKLYYVTTGSDPLFLVFKIKSLHKYEVDQKVVKGKKVG